MDVAGCEYYPSVCFVSPAVSLVVGVCAGRRESTKNKE